MPFVATTAGRVFYAEPAVVFRSCCSTRRCMITLTSIRWLKGWPRDIAPSRWTGRGMDGTLLLDGMFQGTWKTMRSNGKATLHIETFIPLTSPDAQAVTSEGMRLLAFIAPQLDPGITLAKPMVAEPVGG